MRKVALVMGNSDYSDSNKVSGEEDARAMADLLGLLGFEVLPPVLNGDLPTANAALVDFGSKLHDATTVVFFYSGHGFQAGGKNYLLPPRGPVSTAGALLLDDILQILGSAPNAAVKFAFLDACRNDDLLPAGSPKGLTDPPGAPIGVLQAFAASPGQVAASGSAGTLSPYTTALLRYMPQPGLELGKLFDMVRTETFRNSPQQQEPIEAGAAPQNFFFSPPVFVNAVVPEGHSELLVILNGNVVLDTDQPVKDPPLPLRLNAGDNELVLFVSNGKNHHNNHDWDVTEGWSYQLDLLLPNGTTKTFKGEEEFPFKDGPHYGKVFKVAETNLWVDMQSPNLTVVDPKVDTDHIDLLAQGQEILFQATISDLNLSPDDILADAIDLGSAGAILQPFLIELLKSGTILGVAIADPAKTTVNVLGNSALKDLAVACMGNRDERIRDLKASIAAAFQRKPTPFDIFDQGLMASMRLRAQTEGSSLKPEDIRIWTALHDNSQDLMAAAAAAPVAVEASPAIAHQG